MFFFEVSIINILCMAGQWWPILLSRYSRFLECRDISNQARLMRHLHNVAPRRGCHTGSYETSFGETEVSGGGEVMQCR